MSKKDILAQSSLDDSKESLLIFSCTLEMGEISIWRHGERTLGRLTRMIKSREEGKGG